MGVVVPAGVAWGMKLKEVWAGGAALIAPAAVLANGLLASSALGVAASGNSTAWHNRQQGR